MWTGYVALRDVQAENETLKRELQTLQVRLQEERAQAQRTESLRQLLELRERAGLETVASEIIAGRRQPRFPRHDDRQGLVGRAQAGHGRHLAGGRRRPRDSAEPARLPGADAHRSQRRGRRDDRAHARAGHRRRRRATRCAWSTCPGTADVKQGDLVVTSGIDGIYPKGFVIGTVEVVDRGPGTFHEITVRPAVDFSRLEEVLVVTTPPAGARLPTSAAPSAQTRDARAREREPVAALAAADRAGPAAGRDGCWPCRGIRRCRRRWPPGPRSLIVVGRDRRSLHLADPVRAGSAARQRRRPGPGCAVERHHRHRRAGQDGRRLRRRACWGPQFIVTAPLSRFVVFVLATVLHAAIFMGLYMLLGPAAVRRRRMPAVLSQAVGNGFLGVVGAQLVELLPGLRERRRARRVAGIDVN